MTKTQEKKKQICIPRCVQEIGSKSMSSSLWKDLNFDVLENVLACLPMHVLCRFRLVCKKWNHLFSQPSFDALRMLSSRQASSILIAPNWSCTTMTTSTKWHVIDPMEKHSYKLSDSFIMDSYLSSNSNRGLPNTLRQLGWTMYPLAGDGELMYIVYSASAHLRMQRHFVCNPVSKSFHEIPELSESQLQYNNDIVVMSVDNATRAYKIVVIEKFWCDRFPRELFLYESTISTWRKLCEAPYPGFSAFSSIFMKGTFYTLFVDFYSGRIGSNLYLVVLYSCDLETGAWNKMDVAFPHLSTLEENPQLVVSSGQLYMVKYTSCWKPMVTLSIWKIRLETKEVVKVAKIQNFAKLPLKRFGNWRVDPVAVGCVDSIIILCTERRCVKFNLLEKYWQELPALASEYQTMSSGFCAYLVDF